MDDHAYLALSRKINGVLFWSLQQGKNFTHQIRKDVLGYNHPGGIQTIGHYVAVPVYGSVNGDGQVFIYDRDLQNFTQHPLVENKAYCLGIANIDYGDGERYVMAVVTQKHGHTIDFYWSDVGQDLARGNVVFTRFNRWFWQPGTTDTTGWKPDAEFIGHPNSISLAVDEENNLYLLGLHTVPKWKKLSKFFIKRLGGTTLQPPVWAKTEWNCFAFTWMNTPTIRR